MFIVIGKPNCAYCKEALTNLDSLGLPYVYWDLNSVNVNVKTFLETLLKVELGVNTVPQVFEYVGNSEDLIKKLFSSSKGKNHNESS